MSYACYTLNVCDRLKEKHRNYQILFGISKRHFEVNEYRVLLAMVRVFYEYFAASSLHILWGEIRKRKLPTNYEPFMICSCIPGT